MVTRIVILGGGAAALGVAFELTSVAGWEQRYSIDLYQIGWRLGGKCASSRNFSARGRNEEHGLHVLGGFYHNTFQQLRPLYEAWRDCSPHAIPFNQAFFKHSTFTLMQREAEYWRAVRVHGPEDDREPGVDPEHITPWAMLRRLLSWLGNTLREGPPSGESPKARHSLHEVLGVSATEAAQMQLLAARFAGLAEQIEDSPLGIPDTAVLELTAATQTLMARVAQGGGMPGADWVGIVELLLAITRGFVADQLITRGYDSINRFECRAWLRRHGASDRAVACPLFEAGYHYAFAFPDGGSIPDMAAGCGTRGLLRLVFGSHGSFFVHMNGGMGEIFVVPYYEVLKARGVRFHFFQRVEQLVPGEDGRLAAIKVRAQARPTRGPAGYDPLVDYSPGGGKAIRRCWPEAPRSGELDTIATRNPVDLESWARSAGLGDLHTLEVGRDFDLCVAGLSIGTLREVAAPLAFVEPKWRRMLDRAVTCPTIAAQLWREEPVPTFGGISCDGLMTAYERDLDTWADMTFLTELEQPPETGRLGSLSYFCGPFPASRAGADPDVETEKWLQAHAASAFPGLDDGAGGYRVAGELDRCSRINTDPIDLYVTTPAGSVHARLRPDATGFSNLLLAGDWTRNNFDVGCVETAILSARLCARAICGQPQQIYGESDFH